MQLTTYIIIYHFVCYNTHNHLLRRKQQWLLFNSKDTAFSFYNSCMSYSRKSIDGLKNQQFESLPTKNNKLHKRDSLSENHRCTNGTLSTIYSSFSPLNKQFILSTLSECKTDFVPPLENHITMSCNKLT